MAGLSDLPFYLAIIQPLLLLVLSALRSWFIITFFHLLCTCIISGLLKHYYLSSKYTSWHALNLYFTPKCFHFYANNKSALA